MGHENNPPHFTGLGDPRALQLGDMLLLSPQITPLEAWEEFLCSPLMPHLWDLWSPHNPGAAPSLQLELKNPELNFRMSPGDGDMDREG